MFFDVFYFHFRIPKLKTRIREMDVSSQAIPDVVEVRMFVWVSLDGKHERKVTLQ
jgi:hypothetical protein